MEENLELACIGASLCKIVCVSVRVQIAINLFNYLFDAGIFISLSGGQTILLKRVKFVIFVSVKLIIDYWINQLSFVLK